MNTMSQRAYSSHGILSLMLAVALLLSAFSVVLPDSNESSAPPVAEHSHEADVAHSHMEHPDGIVESPQFFTADGQRGGQALEDGYAFAVRSRHGLPLERPPQSSLSLS
jgi:hypothetical protein